MSSLSNLYISQSWQGLLHFGTNASSSTTLGLIEDGTGNSLGLYLNTNGDLKTTTSISSSLIEATKLVVKNKIELTGSVDVLGSVTASNAFITNDLIVSGTIYAKEIHTLIESSSIIFSSGSNILGDSTADTQTLNGKVIVSGSQELTGSLQVLNDISSSTLNGMGNVNKFVTSIQASTSSLNQFSASTLVSLNNINLYTASADNKFLAIQASTASLNAFTASQQPSFNALNAFTASAQISLNNINAFTASTGVSITNLNTFSASAQISIAALNSFTGSAFITTGSNTFYGKQIYSSSVVGLVVPLQVSSATASMDCSLGNFFTLQLTTASVYLNPTNIQSGETVTLKVTQASTPGTLTTATSIKFPQGQTYSATAASGAVDIITFVSFDTSSLNAVATYKLV